MSDIMFYFLAERQSATKYLLEPGVATTRLVQQAIIQDLQKNAKYVVLWTAEQLREPNQSGTSSGIHDLDDFIRANYQLVQRFGNYDVLELRRPQ